VFVATAIDVGIKTGDVGAALKAGISSVPMTIAGGQVGGAFLGTVTTAARTAFGPAVAQALAYAMVGAAGGYGVYQAASHGYYASAGVGAVLTGFGLQQLYANRAAIGAQPVEPGGGNGQTAGQQGAFGQQQNPLMSAQRGHIGVEGDVQSYDQAITYLNQDPETARMTSFLEAGGRGDLTVRTNLVNNDSFNPVTNTVSWDPGSGLVTTNGGVQSPALGLGHELAHAAGLRSLTGSLSLVPAGNYGNLEEFRVISFWEVGAATRLGEGIRYDHLGQVFRAHGPTSLY
jgi:hypothetical protein